LNRYFKKGKNVHFFFDLNDFQRVISDYITLMLMRNGKDIYSNAKGYESSWPVSAERFEDHSDSNVLHI